MNFRANGKLLLTAEYFVLDAALALALPTRLGQSLTIKYIDSNYFQWKSFDENQQQWFEALFIPDTLAIYSSSDLEIAQTLQNILQQTKNLNPLFAIAKGTQVSTSLEFPRLWGLGTSSTLIAMMAAWASVDPYQLLATTFGGSGYDIACATANNPILYQNIKPKPLVENCIFEPNFLEHIFFIYLDKKQNSRSAIAHYRQKIQENQSLIHEMTTLTKAFLGCNNFNAFEKLIIEHENFISKTLMLTRAKTLYFSDFWGEIKSLGAWGGDFVLATSQRSENETKLYFHNKGFNTIIPYKMLIL